MARRRRSRRNNTFRKRFGVRFFDVDIMDESGNVIEKVGSAEERVIRRQALSVRLRARRSMTRKRRYRTVAAMPFEMQIVFNRARMRWHYMGNDPLYEPRPQNVPVPSEPGKPPGVIRGQLKKFLLAHKSSKSLMNRVRGTSFVVGPSLLPGKSTNVTTPETHEYGMTKMNPSGTWGSSVRFADYPARPYMEPALRQAMPAFAAMWKDQVRP